MKPREISVSDYYRPVGEGRRFPLTDRWDTIADEVAIAKVPPMLSKLLLDVNTNLTRVCSDDEVAHHLVETLSRERLMQDSPISDELGGIFDSCGVDERVPVQHKESVILGCPGAGKTTLANAIASRQGRIHIEHLPFVVNVPQEMPPPSYIEQNPYIAILRYSASRLTEHVMGNGLSAISSMVDIDWVTPGSLFQQLVGIAGSLRLSTFPQAWIPFLFALPSIPSEIIYLDVSKKERHRRILEAAKRNPREKRRRKDALEIDDELPVIYKSLISSLQKFGYPSEIIVVSDSRSELSGIRTIPEGELDDFVQSRFPVADNPAPLNVPLLRKLVDAFPVSEEVLEIRKAKLDMFKQGHASVVPEEDIGIGIDRLALLSFLPFERLVNTLVEHPFSENEVSAIMFRLAYKMFLESPELNGLLPEMNYLKKQFIQDRSEVLLEAAQYAVMETLTAGMKKIYDEYMRDNSP